MFKREAIQVETLGFSTKIQIYSELHYRRLTEHRGYLILETGVSFVGSAVEVWTVGYYSLVRCSVDWVNLWMLPRVQESRVVSRATRELSEWLVVSEVVLVHGCPLLEHQIRRRSSWSRSACRQEHCIAQILESIGSPMTCQGIYGFRSQSVQYRPRFRSWTNSDHDCHPSLGFRLRPFQADGSIPDSGRLRRV